MAIEQGMDWMVASRSFGYSERTRNGLDGSLQEIWLYRENKAWNGW